MERWIKERAQAPGRRQQNLQQADEVRRLRAELKRVTEDREILEKAAAYFAKQPG